MLSIYNYTEVHEFLRDSWKAKKKRNPAFSMTAWAKQLGLENSSPLSLAFKGKRALPKKYLPEVVRSLELNGDEGLYLEALVDLSKARTPEQRLFYLKRLNELSPVEGFDNNTVQEYKYLSDPIHTAIIEMTGLKGFRCDPRWIKNKLRFSVTIEEVEEVVNRLVDLNLLKNDPSQKVFIKTHKNLTTEHDVADLATKNYHKNISLFAAEQIFEQSVTEREFGSYTFNLKKNQMPKAKELIREFLNHFFNELEAETNASSDTYQFNVQLFKVTE